jgi:tRNA(Arg) A34 adenosine deaminase TadA
VGHNLRNRSASDQPLLKFIRRAFQLAVHAGEQGYEPYGAVLVVSEEVLLEAASHSLRANRGIDHAELSLLRRARREIPYAVLASATLFTSTEPCILCAADIVRSPLRHVAFGCSGDPDSAGADILLSARPAIWVQGPLLEEEGRSIHSRFRHVQVTGRTHGKR